MIERDSTMGIASYWLSALRILRGTTLTFPWIIHLFITDVAISLLLPISFLFPTVSYNLSSSLAFLVWSGIQNIFRFNGGHITVSGAELPRNESAIVVANHVAWTDFYLIQHLAIRAGMLSRQRYFAKQQLRYVPFLGWGLWAMGMPLVSREWVKDKSEMNRVFNGIIKNQWPIWLVSYSEATRYTPAKYEETVAFCRKRSKPIPKHTLYPRTRGFIATVNALRTSKHVAAVYDLTLAYSHGKMFLEPPSLWETLSTPNLSKKYRMHVHATRFPLEDLPRDDEQLAAWLEERWTEKGEVLEQLKESLSRGESWGGDMKKIE